MIVCEVLWSEKSKFLALICRLGAKSEFFKVGTFEIGFRRVQCSELLPDFSGVAVIHERDFRIL